MKVAGLVLAHEGPELLRRLATKLVTMEMSVFISLDLNAKSQALADAVADVGVTTLRSVSPAYWGGFRLVEATITLVKVALADASIDGFLLMSGDSYPIKSGKIHEIMDCSKDCIEAFEIGHRNSIYERVSRTYIPDSNVGAFNLPEKNAAVRWVDQAFLDDFENVRASFIMKSSGLFPWKFAKGAQWWFLTRRSLETCLKVLEDCDDFALWFRYSSIPDESFFQTLMLNFSNGTIDYRCPVFSDWTRDPSPFVYRRKSDIEVLRSRPEPFARKFSNEHLEVLDEVDGWR